MLKFSGYSYLIRGQPEKWGVSRRGRVALRCEVQYYARGRGEAATAFGARPRGGGRRPTPGPPPGGGPEGLK